MPGSFILQQVLEDPTLSNFEMGLRRLYYPLGFPLEVQTNSRKVIEAASEAWGLFSQSFDMEPMRLSLGVRESDSEEPLPTTSSFMAREHLMTVVMNAHNFFTCHLLQSF